MSSLFSLLSSASGSSSNPVLTAEYTLNHTQIIAATTSAIQILPPPGLSKFYQLERFEAHLNGLSEVIDVDFTGCSGAALDIAPSGAASSFTLRDTGERSITTVRTSLASSTSFFDLHTTIGSPEITQISLSGSLNLTTSSPFAASAIKLYRADNSLVYFWFVASGDTNAVDPALGGTGVRVNLSGSTASIIMTALRDAIVNYINNDTLNTYGFVVSSLSGDTITVATRRGANSITITSFDVGDTTPGGSFSITQISASRTNGIRFGAGHSFLDSDAVNYNLRYSDTTFPTQTGTSPTVPTGLTNHATYYIDSTDSNNVYLYTDSGLTNPATITAVGEGGHNLYKFVSGGFKRTIWFNTGSQTNPTPMDSISTPITISNTDTDIQVARKFRDAMVNGGAYPYARLHTSTVVRLFISRPPDNFTFSTAGAHTTDDGDQSIVPVLSVVQTGSAVAAPYSLSLKVSAQDSGFVDTTFDNTTLDRDTYLNSNTGNTLFLVTSSGSDGRALSTFRNNTLDLVVGSPTLVARSNEAIFISFSPFLRADFTPSLSAAYNDGPEGNITLKITYRILDSLANLG